MKLILKIAGGVFLGILAAFGLYMAFKFWESQVIAKRMVEENEKLLEQEKSEAIAQRALISKAASNLNSLTPEKLVALCGSPLEISYSYRGDNVRLFYMGADGHRVGANFYNRESNKYFEGMYQADATIYDSPRNYETTLSNMNNFDRLHESQIAELPCLMGLAVGH